jgi:vacuolar-type H+-ATPase subunit H
MKNTLLILFILISSVMYGQQDSSIKITLAPNIHLSLPDTLQVNNTPVKEVKTDPFEKNMPWIAAIIIGLISAGINFLVANRLKKSNEANIQRQIASAEEASKKQIENAKETTLLQIASAKEASQKQIENAKETTLLQFKSTIAAKNRQDWLNEVRNQLSELIGQGSRLLLEMEDGGILNAHAQNFAYCEAKILMLLNSRDPEQKILMDNVVEFRKTVVDQEKGKIDTDKFVKDKYAITESARVLFDKHWKKIRNLE